MTRWMHPATNSATSSSLASSSSVFHRKSTSGVDAPIGLNLRTLSGVSMRILGASSSAPTRAASASSSSVRAVVHSALNMPCPSWCAPPMTRASTASLRRAAASCAKTASRSASSEPSPKRRFPIMDAFMASETALWPKLARVAVSLAVSGSSPKVTDETNSFAAKTLPSPVALLRVSSLAASGVESAKMSLPLASFALARVASVVAVSLAVSLAVSVGSESAKMSQPRSPETVLSRAPLPVG
mmetsp:Transcript_6413/g.29316  ORF Transcript_6413/g.29316 Transcript_6413/m.29316 type:complete len:243 (+) Transcript_6413:249-977(+)